MDDDHKFDDGVIKKLFENGLMGVEADPEFGGSGCNFLTMMLVCEELSKVKVVGKIQVVFYIYVIYSNRSIQPSLLSSTFTTL